MGKPILVRCKVVDGMFSDEVVVEIRRSDGTSAFFTVSRSAVEDGRLKALLLSPSLVQIPTSYRDTVAVADEALEALAS